MKLKNYLKEIKSIYGDGISFIDIDECLFNTFSTIYVIDDETGKIIKKLDNQEFNTYELQPGTHYDFREFENAEIFRKTSIPIPKTINRIKRMFKNIDKRNSKVVFLTARSDFDNKEEFLQTFRDHGIPIDNIYVERAGNIRTGTIASKKETIIMKYLSTGKYRRVRMLDDNLENIKTFLKIEKKLPEKLIDLVKRIHNIKEEESIPPIAFFGLLVKENGSIVRLK